LARAAQHASPAEQATIKRKVRAKFPGIAVSGMKKGSVSNKVAEKHGYDEDEE